MIVIMVSIDGTTADAQVLNIEKGSKTGSQTSAVLERIEDGDQAVLLFETLNREVRMSKQRLPEQADINTWFDVWTDGQSTAYICINKVKTKQAYERSSTLIDQLK